MEKKATAQYTTHSSISFSDIQKMESSVKVLEFNNADAAFESLKKNEALRSHADIKYYSTGEEKLDKLPQTVEQLEKAITTFAQRICDGGKGVPVMVSHFTSNNQ